VGWRKEREVVRGREREGSEKEKGEIGRSKQRRGKGPPVRVGVLIWESPLV